MVRIRLRLSNLVSGTALLVLLVAWGLAMSARAGARTVGVATNSNFSIWTDSQESADKILPTAERLRRQIARDIFGQEIPDGFGPATVNISFSSVDRGSSLLTDTPDQTRHMIWIHSTEEMLETTLAHEIAHVVLANRFPRLPGFAHEAIASRYDDAGRFAKRAQALQSMAQTGRWHNLRELFSVRHLPATDHSWYAMSESVAKYLGQLGRGGDETYLKFAVSGAENGDWDLALRRYYGISGIAELQPRWQRWAADRVRRPQ